MLQCVGNVLIQKLIYSVFSYFATVFFHKEQCFSFKCFGNELVTAPENSLCTPPSFSGPDPGSGAFLTT
jgi:hypothetical protein